MVPRSSSQRTGDRAGRVSAAAAVLAVALLSFLAAQACRESRASCAVCGRAECRALAFRVEYEDGASQETCCARCASHAVAQEKDRAVARLEARDFATGKRVDARSAVYVEGSDVEHCSAPKAERGSQGCCMEMAYDRCLPSLIAFERREAASAFIEEHGGRLKSFADLRFGARTKPGERR